MSREISEDLVGLIDFLKGYQLSDLVLDPAFLKILSQQHKKYFSYLTLVAEFTELRKNASLLPNISLKQIEFITESCSDIGSSIFVMTHGAYKASKMMLRSSIETFNKGFCLDWIPDIDTNKSVFAIFDEIKHLPFFGDEPTKGLFNLIHQQYAILCQDTHTATSLHMQHITALKYFPTFRMKDAEQLSEISMQLVASYNALLCMKYNPHFHQMHHKNKGNILENVPKLLRPIIHGIDG